ncbi:MAG: transglutaminase-like domain-containing protein [Dysgonamonadaceae bacterium]|jgi:transglutaminase-like putative cysteine protease|nr:transglutaminase-like domain-containing protein [Dysgonamonadaceae bacterium]
MKTSIFTLLALCLAIVGCNPSGQHFISDKNYLNAVEADLNEKMSVVGADSLFPDFSNDSLSLRENEALKFFYAYLPLGDISDYSPMYYLQNIRASFQAKEEMPWGASVSEELFRHFVLPIRINNENMDSSRVVFYRELKDRVKNLSMYDAILEVNHWCHEKVVYQPSDGRTSSPLASVRTAYGRCGEESTFTVAALRAVGIPARQVYTPRWAHTNDNHAWVEAWADGKWYYMGACEPSPVLDMGWFDAPVKRALLLHTKVFGKYTGPEDIMLQTDNFAEINVTSNYAPVAKTTVEVVDSEGKAVADAKVQFGIYNYAEFYTVLSVNSDSLGKASITTGKGDLSVWVVKDDKIALQTVSAGKQDEYKIHLEYAQGQPFETELDIVPPIEITPESKVSPEQTEANNIRSTYEDSVRNAYTATFISRADAVTFAKEISADTARVAGFLFRSRGNWQEIKDFLYGASKAEKTDLALQLLAAVSSKDLRDTPSAVLSDHLNSVGTAEDSRLFYRYVLNPRVRNELLTPYRSWLQQRLAADLQQSAKENPEALIKWANTIRLADKYNSQRIPISPAGVFKLGVADKGSREIFFVAAARSLGIPARLEEVTGKLQYHHDGVWHDVYFDGEKPSLAKYGSFSLKYTPDKLLGDPQYDNHFSVQKIEGGNMKLLNFRNPEGYEGTVSWKSLFTKPVPIETGYYMLISGTRMASGKVLAEVLTFNVEEGKNTSVDLTMRHEQNDIQVLGSMDPEALFLPKGKSDKQSILATTGRGYFLIAILGVGQEPTKHFVNDLARLKSDFEKWNRQMLLLFADQSQLEKFNLNDFAALPSNIVFGIDEGSPITNALAEELNLGSANLPIVVVADTFGRVVYVSQGYKIGIGDELIQTISKLQKP